ncbi:hypothetical protein R6Q57_005069 [Mikania cordata]
MCSTKTFANSSNGVTQKNPIRDDDGSESFSGGTITGDSASGNTGSGGGDNDDYFGMTFGGDTLTIVPSPTRILFIVFVIYMATTTNTGGLFSLLLL